MDLNDHFTQGLEKTAGLQREDVCLYWSEYVDVLTRIKKLGRQHEMNGHVQPQQIGCASIIQRPHVKKVDTARFGELMHGLQGFGPVPGRYCLNRTHHTAREHPANGWDLCELARPEYAALGRQFPPECRHPKTAIWPRPNVTTRAVT